MRELSLHILDLLQNAREAGSRMVWLTIEEDVAEDRLTIEVTDDGRGMPEEDMKRDHGSVLYHSNDPTRGAGAAALCSGRGTVQRGFEG